MFCTFFTAVCKSGTAGFVPAQDKSSGLAQRNPGNYSLTKVWPDRCWGKKKKRKLTYCTVHYKWNNFPLRESNFPPIFNVSNVPETHQCDYGSPFRPKRATLMVVTLREGESEACQSNNFLRALIGWQWLLLSKSFTSSTTCTSLHITPCSSSLAFQFWNASFSIPDWIDSPTNCTQAYEALKINIVPSALFCFAQVKTFWKHKRYASCIDIYRYTDGV